MRILYALYEMRLLMQRYQESLVLIIVGASGGLGSGLLHFVQEHSDILGKYGSLTTTTRPAFDVTDEESVQKFFKELDQKHPPGAPIHLINASGVSLNGFIHKQSLEEFKKTMDVNVTGNFLLLKHLQPLLKSRPGSSIVILSSVVADLGVPGTAAYATSKASIRGLVRAASREFARFQTRVNAIELGYFERGMINQVSPDVQENLKKEIPLGRFGRIEELFTACDFALSCGYLTGTTIRLNGGLL